VHIPPRPHISVAVLVTVAAVLSAATACSSDANLRQRAGSPTVPQSRTTGLSASSATPTGPVTPTSSRPPGEFTIAFAGDVHFAERVGVRLAANPATVFAQAAPGLRRPDLTMVNLETAITNGGVQQNKAFTFRAPPSALTALRDAGIDVVTMANNHGADFGVSGLRDSLAASRAAQFPVIGIGANAAQAYAPYRTTLGGSQIAIFAADQWQDETTLRLFSAGPSKPGIANAREPQLVESVLAAKKAGYLVIVYLHWGTAYQACPNGDQTALAAQLAEAGAAAVVGTHAHVLQGAGWRADGTYVAYGLGNYLWWRSFGTDQDDNGVLTLTFRDGKVVADQFAPSHVDVRGVPVPAAGERKQRIAAQWAAKRDCTNLSATAPK